MKFLLMIFDDHAQWATAPPDEIDRVMQTHAQLEADLRAQGKYVTCHRLRPGDTAATVRVQGGQRVVTDGPFAETKEIVGGFYLIDCASRAEAIEWAKRLPLAERRSSVEVRPLWED
jgi:hypothetical protein